MKFILVLCVLSVFPLLSSAKRPVKLRNKTKTPTIKEKAFNSRIPLLPVGECAGACIQTAAQVLNYEDIKYLNNQAFQGQNAVAIGNVIEQLPIMKARIQEEGMTKKEADKLTSALVAAATQSASWSDLVAQNKVPEFMRSLITDGPEKHRKQIEEIKKHCKL